MTPQEKAIKKINGPCVVKAGAGTGKTHTIVQKIIHLVDKKICKPSEILCLTFSNEATNNLKKKITKELKDGTNVNVRTFHGFSSDILKEYGHLIKLNINFELLLPDDAKVWMHKYLDITPYYSDSYVNTISTAKDFGIDIDQIRDYANKVKENLGEIKDISELEFELKTLHLNPASSVEERRETKNRKKEITKSIEKYYEYIKYEDFLQAWDKYEKLKCKKNVLDYADLNYNVLKLFKQFDYKDVADKYKYVIIDEFQDTNKLQFELIEYLAKSHRNITVVGDPNQSIFGFRGAYRESFNHFMEVFKVDEKNEVFILDKSWRSTNKILKISHDLIKNNYDDQDECLFVKNAENIEGDKVLTIELKNIEEEARKISEIVEKEISEGIPLSEICILHRTHAQSKLIKQALESKNIPVVSAGKIDLLQKPEIRTVIAYLSILNNLIERTGTGEQSWWNLFHYHNSLLPEDTIKIGRYLKKNRKDNVSIDQVLIENIDEINLSKSGKEIVTRIINKLHDLVKVSNKIIPEIILDIFELTGLNREFTHTRSIRNVEALMNLKAFYDLASNYYRTHEKSLSLFVKYLEILDKLGVNIPASRVSEVNAVRIMTIHAVKGLEFKTVIVSNLAENRFPLTRTFKAPLIPKTLNPDIERMLKDLGEISEKEEIQAIKNFEKESLLYEERRLCYVAFTRAKNKLILTYARSYNKEEDSASRSVFLTEINHQKNENIEYSVDDEEKCTIFAPNSKFEQFKSVLKNQLIESLDSDTFEVLLSRLITYHAVREGKIEDYSKVKWENVIDKEQLTHHIKQQCDQVSCLKFDKSSFTFSPSAVLTYHDCPKKYELAHIFQMPGRGDFETNSASIGSFVHQVLEDGVKASFDSYEQFKKHAEKISKEYEWQDIELKDIYPLLKVFWARHENKYNNKSMAEEWLNIDLGGFSFNGKVDRIDFINDKDVEIIDYKTNKNAVDPVHRSWQLGFYALAVKKQMKLNPVKLTLEMLKLEKPFTADVDKNGNAKAGRSKGFNLFEIEQELINVANSIVHDYETEFKVVEDISKCKFCGYKFYCPKWDED